MIILKNKNVEIILKCKTLYIKFLDLNNITDKELNYILFIYKYIHLISLEYNINFPMVLDFYNLNVSLSSIYNNIKKFVNLLTEIKPISNLTVDYTIILLTDYTKQLVNIILNFYKPVKPFYFISDEKDILKLL